MKTPTTLLTLIFSLFLSLGTNVVFGQCASPVGPPAAGLPGVAFGPVHLQHANLGSGAPVLLDITDCDGDGFLDAFVPWSNVTAAPPATFFTGTVCPTGVHSIRITFVGSAGPTTWRAYGPTGLIITQVRPGGGPQVVTLTSTGPKIVRVELQGDEVCVKQVCWTCKLSVPSFFRGDFNNDGSRDLSDAIGGLNYLFVTGVEPGCLAAADSNDDGVLDVSDPTYLLAYQFTGGPPPAGGMGCSVDETEDNLSCDDNGLCPDDQPTGSLPLSHPVPAQTLPAEVLETAQLFLEQHQDLGQEEGNWLGQVSLGVAYPFFRPSPEGDGTTIAYYEIEILVDGQPSGSITVSVDEDDYPIPSFSTHGSTLSDSLLSLVNSQLPAGESPHQAIRIVRYDTGFHVAEDENGNLLGSLGDMPTLILDLSAQEGEAGNLDGQDFDTTPEVELTEKIYADYAEFRESFAADFAPWIELRRQDAVAEWDDLRNPGVELPGPIPDSGMPGGGGSSWTYYWAGDWGDQRKYRQVPSGTGLNTSKCPSGCGGTAWAMLYGWWDENKGYDLLIGGSGAPVCDTTGTDSAQWSIRNSYIDSYCISVKYIGDYGVTNPWKMDNGHEYAEDRGYSVSYSYYWCATTCSKARQRARDGIRDWGRPSIIGFSYLSAHYAVAYGYAFKGTNRWFKCNMGWSNAMSSCSSSGSPNQQWIKAKVWLGLRMKLSP